MKIKTQKQNKDYVQVYFWFYKKLYNTGYFLSIEVRTFVLLILGSSIDLRLRYPMTVTPGRDTAFILKIYKCPHWISRSSIQD